jgi:hypothetical protein
VLNSDNSSASIRGFYVSGSCELTRIAGSDRNLPTQDSVPATVRFDEHGRFLGAAGISMSVRAFDAEHEHLTEVLRDIVGFQACADRREVLDRGRTPVLASAPEHLSVNRRLRQRR